jgi:hypothetical protein
LVIVEAGEKSPPEWVCIRALELPCLSRCHVYRRPRELVSVPFGPACPICWSGVSNLRRKVERIAHVHSSLRVDVYLSSQNTCENRARKKAARALYVRHGIESTPEGRSLRLLREWLSPSQREQLARKGYFEVVGSDTRQRYRIYLGASQNVCKVDERGRPGMGLCFMPTGSLPIGDVMLAQKIALEIREDEVRTVGQMFVPSPFLFSRARPLL